MHGHSQPDCTRFKGRSFLERFRYAAAGIHVAFSREKSFRSQLALAAAAMLITVALNPGLLWCAVVALTIGLVLAFELMNAALEYFIDHLHPELAVEIRHSKDAAAGAVLVTSFTALAVGALMAAAKLFG